MALIHQETWVRHGTNGIGLSDHQNRYSNGVRIGNWVENEFGDSLKATSPARPVFDHVTTVQTDFIGRERDTDNTKVNHLPNNSNVQTAHGPDEVHDLRLMTTTYDLAMSHVEGPRRIDTLMWSGNTKVDTAIPTATYGRMSLLDKKKAEWAAEKESSWQTAYKNQYVKPVGAVRETRGVVPVNKNDCNFSHDPRPHINMGLRGYP